VEALNKGKSAEIAARIKSLTHAGARKLVLDLRDVSQGDAAEGIAVANLFLNHGEIAHLQGQKYPRETFTADPQKDVTSLPLAVLVNRGTAGPAEIVAGAVLENARGDVVGDKTFGAGSVQKLIDIPGGAALILTVAKYYTQSGKAIQDTAITPSVVVSDNDDDAVLPDDEEGNPDNTAPAKAPQREDEPLKRAVELLKGKNG
jgi:carboxyl-terminal processing protease